MLCRISLICFNIILYSPVASKQSNRRSLLYASSMTYLGRTTGRHRHGVGKGEGEQERGGNEYRGLEGQGLTRQGTDEERRWARRASRGKEREQGKIKTVGGVP